MAAHTLTAEDAVYFWGGSASDSWSGSLHDEDSLSEQDMINLICSAKPHMVQKLHGLPLSHAHMPHMDAGTSSEFGANVDSTTNSCLDRLVQNLPAEERGGLIVHRDCFVDGLRDDGQIAAAAEKLYSRFELTDGAFSRSRTLIDESEYPSNSTQATKRRKEKQHEISFILQQIAREERRVKAFRRLDSSNLLIVTPPDMLPRSEQYKKQGLTGRDDQKWGKSRARPETDEDLHDIVPDGQNGDKEVTLHCYCREPDDGSEMIRCRAPSCLLGWIHVRCSGLQRRPAIHEPFYCEYCVEVFSGVDANLEEIRPLSTPADAASVVCSQDPEFGREKDDGNSNEPDVISGPTLDRDRDAARRKGVDTHQSEKPTNALPIIQTGFRAINQNPHSVFDGPSFLSSDPFFPCHDIQISTGLVAASSSKC